MLDLVIRGTLILVFAFAAAGVMRRASAAARHLLWASTLAGLLVLPAVVRLGPAVRVTVPELAPVVASDVSVHVRSHRRTRARVMNTAPSATAHIASSEMAPLSEMPPSSEMAPDPALAVNAPSADAPSADGPSADAPWADAPWADAPWADAPRAALAPATPAPVTPAAMTPARVAHDHAHARSAARTLAGVWQRAWASRWLIWAAGMLLVLGRLLLGMGRVRAFVRETAPVTDPEWTMLLARVARRLGVYRRVMLRSGPAGSVPVTCGIVSPVIILPDEAEDWDDERRELVLTHELAHVRRLDVLTHIVGQCAVALFWFHPLAWIAAARMRLERERACDDLVLVAGARPSRYAGDLLDLVQTLNGATAPAAAALAMARRTEIEGRLLAILDAAVQRGPLGARRIAGALAVAALGVVTIAAVRPVAPKPTPSAAAVVVLPALAAVTDVAQVRPAVRIVGGSTNYVALADIAEAAATIASDASKREVLFEIGQRYGASDTLRHAFFGAINTFVSSTERKRVLLALIGRESRDDQTMIEVVRSASQMASDHDKATVLRTVAGLDPLIDPALRHEFFAAVGTLASSSERTRVLLAVLGEARARGRSQPAQNALIARLALAAATGLPSSSDKVRVLRAVVRGGWLSDATVSRDFNICLSTLGSGLDYHYVVSGGGD